MDVWLTRLVLCTVFLLALTSEKTSCKTIGTDVKDLLVCSKYDFEEKVLDKVIRMDLKMEMWENIFDKNNMDIKLALDKVAEVIKDMKHHMHNVKRESSNVLSDVIKKLDLLMENANTNVTQAVSRVNNQVESMILTTKETITNMTKNVNQETKEIFVETKSNVSDVLKNIQTDTKDELLRTKQRVRQEIDKLNKEIDRTNSRTGTSISTAIGVTYIRWGRKQCPSNAETVYTGYTGGGHSDNSGSAPEPVCLPMDPNYNKSAGGYANMYGAIYSGNFFAQGSNAHDVPCTVCRVLNVSSVIMIPGKNVCTSGWRREYHGYLAAASPGYKAASSYVCIDIDAEHDAGGWGSSGTGKLFYAVNGQCGVLRCPPYKNNYPLTCVVCSK